MVWTFALYYSDFTERYLFESQDECINYIKECFEDKELLEKELYLKAYCREKDSKTVFIFIRDNTDRDGTGPKITMNMIFRDDRHNEEYWPFTITDEEENVKWNIAFEYAYELELDEEKR